MKSEKIVFCLAAEDTIVNDTVKVIANITAMVARDADEAKLRASIRAMLNRFIAAQWQFSNLTRFFDDSGLEKITLTASTRVPEAENRALDQRRQDASLPDQGLMINRVKTDLTFPTTLIEKTEQALRRELIRKAREECDALAEAMGRAMHIARIVYDPDQRDDGYSNKSLPRNFASVASAGYGSGFGPESSDDAIGNAQKRTMQAVVTLVMA